MADVGTEGTAGPRAVRTETLNLLTALQATGLSELDALAEAAKAVPVDRLVPFLLPGLRAAARKPSKRGDSPLGVFLVMVGDAMPALTQAAFASPKLDGLRVKAALRLAGTEWLTALPRNLQVDGVLDLACCANLSELPEGLRVKGALRIPNCPNLTHLPENLTANAVVLESSKFENFLEGMACPNCGSPDDIRALCQGNDAYGEKVEEWAYIYDDGPDLKLIEGDSDWLGPCNCAACDFTGTRNHFDDFGPGLGEAAPPATPWDGILPAGVSEVCP
jgi:hypothetical protein